MTAHFDYEQTVERYRQLVNEKKEIERKIKANTCDAVALAGLRSDYRTVVEEMETIYNINIEFFNQTPPY